MTDDLRQLLHQAAPAPSQVLTTTMLEREAQLRRRRRHRSAAAGLALVTAAATVIAVVTTQGPGRDGVATITGDPGPSPQATPTPSPQPTVTQPVAKMPTLTVHLDGLPADAEGSAVEVTGTNFTPNRLVQIRECPPSTDCDAIAPVGSTSADAAGDFTAWVTLTTTLSVAGSNNIACKQACFLVARSLPLTSNVTAVTAPFNIGDPVAGSGPACSATALQASYGGGVSPMTGEHSAIVNLRNVTQESCWVYGYPMVQLLNGGKVLPFGSTSGGSYIFDKPALVQVAPGASAHFVVAKYRCDGGGEASADALLFALPDTGTRVSVPLTGGPDQVGLQYCSTPGEYAPAKALDPGNTIQIGPLAAGALG